jgi:hypothetical protein
MLGLMCMCESEASFTLCLQDFPLVRLHELAMPSELLSILLIGRVHVGAAIHVIDMVGLYRSPGEVGGILLDSTCFRSALRKWGRTVSTLRPRLKNWKYKNDMPPTPLLFSMDGWLGEPTDTLHWRFSTVLCLFDLEIRLAAPPSSIFLLFFCCTEEDGEKKKKTHFPSSLYSSNFFLGLVWFSCIIVAK